VSGWRSALADGWQGQVIRFAAVGLGAAGVDYGILSGLVALGLSPYPARAISIAVALVVTWQLHRRLTFRTVAPPSWAEFGSFTLTALLGILINYALYSGLLLLGAALWLAFVVGTVVAAVFNFVRYRLLLAPK
jgi:putative flippase GtrA